MGGPQLPAAARSLRGGTDPAVRQWVRIRAIPVSYRVQPQPLNCETFVLLTTSVPESTCLGTCLPATASRANCTALIAILCGNWATVAVSLPLLIILYSWGSPSKPTISSFPD